MNRILLNGFRLLKREMCHNLIVVVHNSYNNYFLHLAKNSKQRKHLK